MKPGVLEVKALPVKLTTTATRVIKIWNNRGIPENRVGGGSATDISDNNQK